MFLCAQSLSFWILDCLFFLEPSFAFNRYASYILTFIIRYGRQDRLSNPHLIEPIIRIFKAQTPNDFASSSRLFSCTGELYVSLLCMRLPEGPGIVSLTLYVSTSSTWCDWQKNGFSYVR